MKEDYQVLRKALKDCSDELMQMRLKESAIQLREIKLSVFRNDHPGVLAAWEKYQLVLKLSGYNNVR